MYKGPFKRTMFKFQYFRFSYEIILVIPNTVHNHLYKQSNLPEQLNMVTQDRCLLNTGLFDMKCTVKGNKN